MHPLSVVIDTLDCLIYTFDIKFMLQVDSISKSPIVVPELILKVGGHYIRKLGCCHLVTDICLIDIVVDLAYGSF